MVTTSKTLTTLGWESRAIARASRINRARLLVGHGQRLQRDAALEVGSEAR
jgi:hypothetical protein